MTTTARPTMGIVGAGAMGSRMARRLVEAGHPVVVWNRTGARVQDLLELGVKPAATPAETARRCDGVITMVSDPNALTSVTEGDEGILSGLDASTTLIQMSTVSPESTARLAGLLPDAALLDAPVLGSTSEAEQGLLKVFVGGSPDVAEWWVPTLSVLGTPLHVGPVGKGTAAKLVANAALLGTMCLLGEALALAQTLGLPAQTAFEVLSETPLAAQAQRRREPVTTGNYPLRFSLALAGKDARLIVDAHAGLRLQAAARAWFDEAQRAGFAEEDYSTVLQHILDAAAPPPSRRHEID